MVKKLIQTFLTKLFIKSKSVNFKFLREFRENKKRALFEINSRITAFIFHALLHLLPDLPVEPPYCVVTFRADCHAPSVRNKIITF